MKKTISLLAALMLVVMLLPATAMAAYEATKPENNALTVNHTLTLSDQSLNSLPYTIEYTFSVDDVVIVQPTDIVNPNLAVTGKPSIAPITYGPEDTLDTATRTFQKTLSIDWSNVQIKEPGVYRWAVNQKCTDGDPNQNASNNSSRTYLYAYATDNAGALTIDQFGMTTDEALNVKDSNMEEQYPANQVNLSIKKLVTGTQASKDQYFKFTLNLTFPTTISATYNIAAATGSTYDLTVPATAYTNATNNPHQIVVNSSSSATVDLWLKDGQTVVISGLMYGTGYTIVESSNGYTVDSIVQTDTQSGATLTTTTATATDSSMINNNTITYTNKKDAVIPTGITLNTAAPVMGILLAMSLLAVLYIGKRKEYQV